MDSLITTKMDDLKKGPYNPLKFYQGKDGKWYWHLRHPNGNIGCDSGEGYTTEQGAKEGFRDVKKLILMYDL